MRDACLSALVGGCLIFTASSPSCAGEGPFSRLRDRLSPSRWGTAEEAGTTGATPAFPSTDDLLNVPTVVVRPSPPPRALLPATARPAPVDSPFAAAPARTDEPPAASAPATASITLASHAEAPPPEMPPELPQQQLAPATLPDPAAAESTTDPAQLADVLSLEQAERIALARNPSLQQAGALVDKAQGLQRQIGRYPNPLIGYVGDDIGDEGTAGSQGIMLQQTIMLGRQLEWNEKMAGWETQAMAWQAQAQQYRVRNDVRRQYYLALGAQLRVDLASELYKIASDAVTNAQQLREALIAADPDVLQAEIQAQEVSVILRNAEYQRDAAWRQLANLMGAPQMPTRELANILESDAGARDLETARQQLLALSPELQQARAEVQRAAARIRREELQQVPGVQLQLGAMHMNTSGSDVISVQVGVPVPVFNTNAGNISRAVGEHRRACWNVQRVELALDSLLASSFQTYRDAANRVRTYREEILPRQNRTLSLIQAAYPTQFDFLRLLTARRSYYEARLAYLQALVDVRTAEVALDGLLLSGGLQDLEDTTLDDTMRWNAFSGQ